MIAPYFLPRHRLHFEGCRPQVGLLVECSIGKQGLRFIVAHRGVYNNIISFFPVNRGSNLMLITELERIDDPNNLVEVSTGRSGVSNRQADNLLRVNHKDRADSERKALRITIRGILLILHVVERRDLPVLVGNDRELHVSRASLGSILVDIFDPFVVFFQSVCGNTDEFDVALSEVFRAPGDFTELSGAHWGEVTGVREQNGPGVTDPFVELDRSCGGFGCKIRGSISEA